VGETVAAKGKGEAGAFKEQTSDTDLECRRHSLLSHDGWFMKDLVHKAKSRWQRFSKWARIVIIIVVLVLIGARLALPHAVQRYVNRKLDQLPEYDGRIGNVDVHLIRGAYSIDGVEILKTSGKVSEPFVFARKVDFSIEWRELLHGSLVSEIYVDRARLNFVKGPTKEQSQTEIDKSWIDIVEELFPFKINRFEIQHSAVWFRDFHKNPKVDLYITNLVVVATNLTNSRDLQTKLPAALWAEGKSLGGGDLKIECRMDPLARKPTFDLDAQIEHVDLRALNDFLRAYAKVDVKKGTLGVYSEVAASEGRFEGYVKPLLEDIDIVDLKEDKNPLKIAWEAIVAVFVHGFKNHPKDRFGTEIPFAGTFDNPDVGVWATVVNMLRNAFVRALPPRIEESVSPETVEKRKRK
jgi:hypothetical protein